jgi:RimJ/RimL family protein N-acetyltransferase
MKTQQKHLSGSIQAENGIGHQLFEAEAICLAPMDHDNDPEIVSRWTHDASYQRMVSPDPSLPLSPDQVKKVYEKIEKRAGENKNLFYFTIRDKTDDRLIGYAKIDNIAWTNGVGTVSLGIGDPQDRRRGFGTQALSLLQRYAFDELNLYKLVAVVPEYNSPALALFERAGFSVEVRRRQALARDGRRWQEMLFGQTRDEWLSGSEK